MKYSMSVLAAAVVAIAAPTVSKASPGEFAVWLDGNVGPDTNNIPGLLDSHFGAGSAVQVTTAELDTPGFLAANGFAAVVVSRSGDNFGTYLDSLAEANIQAYVGAADTPGQGGVAVFTNDAADNIGVADEGDPFDPSLNTLFINAATFAAASGHGYIGEFNGAAMAFATDSNGAGIDLLDGNAGALQANPDGEQEQYVYGVGPIGAGNPIDNGVTFPFTDSDESTFLTIVSGADSNNIVDVYTDPGANGDPAILANRFVISGGNPTAPDAASTSLLLAFGLSAAVAARRKLQAA